MSFALPLQQNAMGVANGQMTPTPFHLIFHRPHSWRPVDQTVSRIYGFVDQKMLRTYTSLNCIEYGNNPKIQTRRF